MADGAGSQFMRATKYENLEESSQTRGEPQPPLELPVDPALPLFDLPAPDAVELDPVNLRELIGQRRTLRNYVDAPLSLAELSYLLWCTQGVQDTRDAYTTVRTVPSAGARHAFETILLVNMVDGLEPGIYRYVALSHQLVKLDLGSDLTKRFTVACHNQEHVTRSAVTFAWVAITERMTWRYVARGYRYLHLDAGHVCQNLYLAAETIGSGVCAIVAFNDDEINALLGIDGESQFVIYVATVGKRRVR